MNINLFLAIVVVGGGAILQSLGILLLFKAMP